MSDSTYDLGTNTSVPLTAVETDADSNPVSYPVAFSTNDTEGTIVALTDNGDGSATVARVDPSSAGTVKITVVVTNPDGSTVTGTLAFSLSAQGAPAQPNAVDVAIVPGVPTA